MKYTKKKRKQVKHFVPTIFVPTFLGFKLKTENWNQLWRLDDLTEIKV